MGKTLRRLHIDKKVWKWYVKGQRGNIIVFSPSGERYEIQLQDFLRVSHPLWEIEYLTYKIRPSEVKDYIIKKEATSWD